MDLLELINTPNSKMGRITVSDSFSDRLMQRIEEEDSPQVVEMSFAQKMLSMASLLAICIALGVLIGNISEYRTLSRGKGKQSIEQFRDTYHLYTIRKSESRQIPCY